MNANQICPRCGNAVPAGTPVERCPRCLLAAGLASEEPPSGFQASEPPVYSGGLGPTTPSPQPYRFVPPTPAELAPHFPQLEILELIGQGGMGAVYKARQPGLERLVAVKILPPDVASDPAFAERFGREARALAQLNHPHIVTVFDYGRTGEFCYFIMEFVDGVDLRRAMQAGALAPEKALAIVGQVCDALQYAHDEGIVHRDIKPENILLDARGRVKIADFGLSKLMGQGPLESPLTGTYQIMGTLRYMAPEQMHGTRSVDHRADIYSLGVVFYELLTGEVPAGRFEPPSQLAPIDARLDDVVLRALQRAPERRYQRAGDVRTDVDAVTSTPDAAVGPAKPEAVPASDREALEAQIEAARGHTLGPGASLVVVGLAAFGLFFAWGAYGLLEDVSLKSLYAFSLMCSLFGLVTACGGVALLTVRFRELAWVGAVVAFPLSMIGLPIGPWAMYALSLSAVKKGYTARRKLTQLGRPQPTSSALRRPPKLTAAELLPTARALFLAGLAMVLVSTVLCAWCGMTLARILQSFPEPTVRTYINAAGLPATVDVNPFRNMQNVFIPLLMVQFGALALGGVLMVAATTAARLEFRGFAFGAAVAGMLPISPAWVFTLPAGIWMLLALSRREAAQAFAAAEEYAWDEKNPRPSLWVRWSTADGIAAALLGLLLLTSLAPWMRFNLQGIGATQFGIDFPHGLAVCLFASAALVFALGTALFGFGKRVRAALAFGGGAAAIGCTGWLLLIRTQPEFAAVNELAEYTRPFGYPTVLWGILAALACGVLLVIYAIIDLLFSFSRHDANTGESAAPATPATSERQVRGPAIGLIVAGVLGGMLDMIPIFVLQTELGNPPDVVAKFIFLLVLLLFPLLRITMVAAGIRLLQLRSRGLAFAAAIIAFIPTNIAFLLAVPIGIWTLLVLQREEVRKAFAWQRELDATPTK